MTEEKDSVAIPSLQLKDVFLGVRGIPGVPFVCHRWSDKAKKEMLDKQMKKAKNAKEAKDPRRDYVDSLYWLSEKPNKPTDAQMTKSKFGFPSIAFKSAAVTACTSIGNMKKIEARQAFHVLGEFVTIEGQPRMREDMVRVGMGTADIRYRGEFPEWKAKLHIRFNSSVISPEQLVHMFNTAGFAVGVGENRPEKNGAWGMFEVDADQPLEVAAGG